MAILEDFSNDYYNLLEWYGIELLFGLFGLGPVLSKYLASKIYLMS